MSAPLAEELQDRPVCILCGRGGRVGVNTIGPREAEMRKKP